MNIVFEPAPAGTTHFLRFAIGWCKSVMKGCHGNKASEFRPIRTERDELMDAITSQGFLNRDGGVCGQIADAILAAGFKRDGGAA